MSCFPFDPDALLGLGLLGVAEDSGPFTDARVRHEEDAGALLVLIQQVT